VEALVMFLIGTGVGVFSIGLVRLASKEWKNEKIKNIEMVKAGVWLLIGGLLLLKYIWDSSYFVQ